MKNMTRILILTLVLVMAFGVVEAASAVSINFTFTNILDSLDSNPGNVTKDAGSYYVILDTSSTASSINVFGFRARKSSDDSSASSYRTMDYVGKKSVSYKSGIATGTSVYLRCKKDDSSVYGGPLDANGTFTP